MKGAGGEVQQHGWETRKKREATKGDDGNSWEKRGEGKRPSRSPTNGKVRGGEDKAKGKKEGVQGQMTAKLSSNCAKGGLNKFLERRHGGGENDKKEDTRFLVTWAVQVGGLTKKNGPKGKGGKTPKGLGGEKW